ncbi:MAG TPA: substrate-binding domain-containing protein [Planctomycetota bacterium]
MTNRCASACVRLTTLAVVLGLLACFACRPAWSPDGRRLLFHTRIAKDSVGIAMFDRDKGRADLLFVPGSGKTAAVPLWLPDGKGVVVVWTDQDHEKQLSVAIMSIPRCGKVRTLTVPGGENTTNNILVPPVLVGHRLLFASNGIARLDLDSNTTTMIAPVVDVAQEDGAPGEQLVVTRRGQGVCYFSMQKGGDMDWEIGTVDPDTLQRTPILKPPDQRWEVKPLPAFTRDLTRIALPARSREEPRGHAILVFRDGSLENVLPVDGEVDFGSVEWLPDGASLCVSLCRHDREKALLKWSLLETTISGSVSRETPIVQTRHRGRNRESAGLACQVALSPDGRIAALSTALLDDLQEGDHGLYLVDLKHKDRTVTKVPFPVAAQELTLAGSDAMTGFAELCMQGFLSTDANPACMATVTGGGSSAGLSKLLRGTADLALMSRPVKPAELDEAKKRGVTLTEHRVATAALAVCVHKDNPLASLTIEQLGEIFGDDGVQRWSELRVPMPAESDAIVAATPQVVAPSYVHFRELVLGVFGPASTNVLLASSRDVIEVVSQRQGAIGYVPLLDVTDAVKVVPIAAKPGMAPCTPSLATIADGSYPLAQPLLLYSRTDRKPTVTAFLEWLASDAGKKVVEQAALHPVR